MAERVQALKEPIEEKTLQLDGNPQKGVDFAALLLEAKLLTLERVATRRENGYS